MNTGYFPLFIMIALTLLGHICFKNFSVSFAAGKNLCKTALRFLHPAFIAGFVFMAAAPLFYFKALETIELSTAYSFTAINQIAVPLSGILIFGEVFSLKKAAGIILVTAGMLAWNL